MGEKRKGKEGKTCRLAFLLTLDKCNRKMGFDDDGDEFRDIQEKEQIMSFIKENKGLIWPKKKKEHLCYKKH